MPGKGILIGFERGIDGFADVMRFKIQLHGMGVELRHLRGLAHQPVQPVALLVDDREQLLA